MPIYNGDNAREAFESTLIKAKAFIDSISYKNKIVILSAWNE